ncbi:MAG TPA: hypothetical protein VN867_01815 [Candidatus Binataceae bacterium]|nr:hypothetical protein [Candidatus Binataceae bacterium]
MKIIEHKKQGRSGRHSSENRGNRVEQSESPKIRLSFTNAGIVAFGNCVRRKMGLQLSPQLGNQSKDRSCGTRAGWQCCQVIFALQNRSQHLRPWPV